MKKKLFKIGMKLIAFLLSLNAFAQADPVFTALNPATDQVTITNIGDASVDIGAYQLCTTGFIYSAISSLTTEDTDLGAGDSITVTWAPIPDATGGTLILFTNRSFGSTDPNVLRDYMRWGTTANFRTSNGVASGRWSNDSESITCPAPYSTGGTRGGNPIAWGDADGGTISMNAARTTELNVNGTTRIDGDLAVSICVDGRPDPIAVEHITQATNRSYLYVITDNSAEETILNIVAENEISLDGAGAGTCRIWGWSYSGLGGRDGALATFGGGPLQDMRDANCSSVSEQFITVVREEAIGGTVAIDTVNTTDASGTTTVTDATTATIIVGDAIANPIVVTHSNPGAENLSYRYVITDAATGLILNVVNTNTIDLNGVAAGTCEIWGWSYRGVEGNGLNQVGLPLSSLDDLDCSDISDNQITVERIAEVNGDADPVFTALNPAADQVTITNIGDASVDIGAYQLCTTGFVYSAISSLTTESTVLAAGDSITVTWADIPDATGGTLILFTNTSFGSTDPNVLRDYVRWGTTVNFRTSNGVASGRWSNDSESITCPAPYSTGGTRGGNPIAWGDADGGTISMNAARTTELNVNGTTRIDGDLAVSICVDGRPDPIAVEHITQATNRSYLYVITDNSAEETILNIVAENEISLDGAGAGTCRIWGWSYSGLGGRDGALATFGGGPLQDLRDANCSSVSEQFITVVREEAIGGTVAIDLVATGNPNGTTSFNGDTEAIICIDSLADPIVVTHSNPGAENLSYRYVITDAATGLILNVVNTNTIDLNGVAPGTCEIWGWSYRGVPGNGLDQVGQPLSSLDDLDCSDISDNQITIIREAAIGGTVAIDLDATGNPNGTTSFNGDTEAVICIDSLADPIVVTHSNPGAENLSYRYVITDAATGLILNVVNTDTIDLNGVAPGTCEIWGWSYRGVPGNGLDQVGQPLSSLDDLDCSDISDNQITIIREAATGGTVAIDLVATGNPNGTTSFNGDTEAVICIDSLADPIVVTHSNPGAENLSYRYVITDAATGLILNVVNSDTIDLNGVAPGTCEIWGWSYRGVEGNGLNQVGLPLSSLDDLDCSDISDNQITVIRAAADADSFIFIDAEATGNLNNTTVVEDEFFATICGDSQADSLVINVETTSELPYHLVIVDGDTSIITDVLEVEGSSAVVDLNGPISASFEVLGVSGVFQENVADFVGRDVGDIFDLVNDTDCLELSTESVFALRDIANGGSVAINLGATGNPNGTTSFNGIREAVICIDSQADPIVVTHTNPGAENLSYRYVITDAATGLILNVVNSDTIDLNGVAPGTCEIWGWSYRGVEGNGLNQVGLPLSSLDDLDCSDISDNQITIIREAATGGSVAIDLVATGNPNGTTSFNGDTEAVICIDSLADPIVVTHSNPGAENLSYRYVITDAATGLILNVINSNSIDLNGVAPGTCEIWGWSYRGVEGNGLNQVGQPLSSLDDLDCSDISDNQITIIREAAIGGTVAIDTVSTTDASGTTTVTDATTATIIVGDAIANPIVVTHSNPGAENLSYRYVITDAATGLILNVVNTDTIDLNGVAAGTCEIWGWSYRGVEGNGLNQVGEPLSSLDDLDCSDISDNQITVIREQGPALPVQNFIVRAIGESCETSNDGSISISASEEFSYTATINGLSLTNVSQAFTNEISFDSLEAGEYSVCITVAEINDFEQCFSLVVSEPQNLEVIENFENSAKELNLQLTGGELYEINLNGEITFTAESEITLQLSEGENNFTVKTDKDCQGLFSSKIIIEAEDTFNVVPNPVQDNLNLIFTNSNNELVSVTLYDISGKRVGTFTTTRNNEEASFNVSGLSAGIYFLNVEGTSTNVKILKK